MGGLQPSQDDKFIYDLRSSGRTPGKRGIFFRGNFFITPEGDTFLDMTNFKKGVVWVNGHNLGRYWEKGPQKRLYCPASWLRNGQNEIIIFDLLQTEPKIVIGKRQWNDCQTSILVVRLVILVLIALNGKPSFARSCSTIMYFIPAISFTSSISLKLITPSPTGAKSSSPTVV